jgi:hypothetical protein
MKLNKHQKGWRYLKLQEARYGISRAIKELRDNALKPLDELLDFEKIELTHVVEGQENE